MAEQGETGDFSRVFVLDPAMRARIEGRGFRTALDVGCGEGRFCRILADIGIRPTGIDPTARLLDAARARDPGGDYRLARAEALPVADAAYDLVVSYLTLIDIEGFEEAIAEMGRALRPGGTLLVANMNGFVSATIEGNGGRAWIEDAEGRARYVALDRYLEPRGDWVAWRGIRILNWHRPLEAYMRAFLGAGLVLRHFAEPAPTGGPDARRRRNARVPFFHVMEWEKPDAPRLLPQPGP